MTRNGLASSVLILAALGACGCSQGTGATGGPGLDAASTGDSGGDGGELTDGTTTPLDAPADHPADVAADASADGAVDAPANQAMDALADGSGDGAIDAPGDATGADGFGGPPCSTPCGHGTCVPSSGACSCDTSWAGAMCDVSAPVLTPGTPVGGTVTLGSWSYFSWTGMASGLTVTLTETATVGLVWVYLGVGQAPDPSSNLASNEDTQSATHTVSYTFAGPGTQTWYIGAYGQPAVSSGTQVSFNVQITVIP